MVDVQKTYTASIGILFLLIGIILGFIFKFISFFHITAGIVLIWLGYKGSGKRVNKWIGIILIILGVIESVPILSILGIIPVFSLFLQSFAWYSAPVNLIIGVISLLVAYDIVTDAKTFWEVTAKWYFFPIFYVLLVLLLIFIKLKGNLFGEGAIFGYFIPVVVSMPSGLLYFIYFPPLSKYITEAIQLPLIFSFHAVSVISIILIQYFKIRRNKILKWLIITLLVLILLAFFGCVVQPLPDG